MRENEIKMSFRLTLIILIIHKFRVIFAILKYFRMKSLRLTIGFMLLLFTQPTFAAGSNEPDSVYLFSYATNKNQNHNGLHFAWSRDKITWYRIGNEYAFVK